MELEDLLSFSQQSAIGPCLEADEFSSHRDSFCLRYS
jgi:hypothetical protein